MIEILSFAAEITVGVLLITLAWDRAASSETVAANSAQATRNDHAKAILEKLYRIAIGSTARGLMDGATFESLRQSEHAQGIADLRRELLELGSEGERDSLTGLGTGLELERWLEGPFQHGGQLAVFDIDGLEGINQRTSMADGDAMLSAYGRELEKHLAWLGPVFRVQGGKFACLAPSLRREEMIRALEQFELRYAWHRGEEVQSITASGCIVEHSALQDPRGWVTVLDEGIAAAKFAGQAHLAWLHEGQWQSHPAEKDEEASESVNSPNDDDATAVTTKNSVAEPRGEELRSDGAEEKPLEVVSAGSKMEPVEAAKVQTAMEPQEVPEIRGEGSETLKPEEKTESPTTKPAEAPYKIEVSSESMSERATADDIQALLDQLKNGNKPGFGEGTNAVGSPNSTGESKPIEAQSPDADAAALTSDATSSAASLTAEAVNPASPDVVSAGPDSANASDTNASQEVAANASPFATKEVSSDAAPSITQDDIESLLGNVRTVSSEVQRSIEKQGSGTVAKNEQPIPTGQESSPKGLDTMVTGASKEETASSGDIEALFAAFSKQK